MSTVTSSVSVSDLYRPPGRSLRLLMMLLAGVAAVLSGYLSWASLTDGTVAGCGPDGGCHDVLGSSWSRWLGVPVSVGGLVVYGSLFAGLLFTGADEPPRQQRRAWRVLLPCALIAIASAVWFISLQLFVIDGRLCFYCLTIHGCGVGLATLVLMTAPLGTPAGQISRLHVTGGTFVKQLAAAMVVMGILIAGQVVMPYQPGTQQVVENPHYVADLTTIGMNSSAAGMPGSTLPAMGTPGATNSTNASLAPATNSAKPERRIYPFGRLTPINTYDEPILGSPDAEHIVIEMFDYNCSFCRAMHHHLQAARQRYGRQLAVIAVPVPLNRSCNPHVMRTGPQNQTSCDLARAAYAVWIHRPHEFEAFHHWLFSGDQPRTMDEVRERGSAIFGSAQAFDEAMAQHAVTTRLVRSADLFSHAGKGALPKLLVGRVILNGAAENETQLFTHLESRLRIRPAP